MPTPKGSNVSKRVARQRQLWVDGGGVELFRGATINLLSEDVLLEIFHFYVGDNDEDYPVDGWSSLVHVCRRWRHVVFASPLRLNLQLLCTHKTPVKKLLGIWPELPITIDVQYSPRQWKGVTNIDAALKHNNRVCEITIWKIPSPLLKRIARMQKQFTALTYLDLWSNDETAPVIPDSFLGGSAPRLRTLILEGIPFPGLPKLLLSTHHLVDLHLWSIPHSGYISPEAMVTILSSLTSLRELRLDFQSPRPCPGLINRRPSALTRAVLPALISLHFKGVSEYFEVLISQIDIPLLKNITIVFFNQLVFDVPQLREFILHTEAFKALHRARIYIFNNSVQVTFPLTNPEEAYGKHLELGISCKPLDWQLSSLTQVCNSSLPPLPALERLDILWERRSKLQDDIENSQWLEVLQPFITLKDLHLDEYVSPYVAPALRELAEERGTEVLPALQNIFVQSLESSGPIQEAIAQFATARQHLGYPTAVRNWE